LILIILSKLENSKSEIRRLIKGNAIKINDEIISDEKLIIKKNYLKKLFKTFYWKKKTY
jgi:tyrosyl-tRNA synthetase